jgi:hypothetical protein
MKLSALALSMLPVVFVGCSSAVPDSIQQTNTALATAGKGRDACLARAAASHVESVTLHGFALSWPAQTGIADVFVCAQIVDGSVSPSCGETDADGRIDLTVDPCENVRVIYSHDGYLKVNQLNVIDTADVTVGTRMLTTVQVQHLTAAAGQTYDPDKSLPIITTFDADHHPLAGVTVSNEPNDGKGAAWYLSASGVPTTTLTETSAFGIMGFFNVEAGTRQVTATASGKTCVPHISMPGDASNSATIEALPGSISEALFTCN